MNHITTQSGKQFEQLDNESILDSAKKAGINFEYSCKNGRCSTCKCKLISGQTSSYSDELGLTEQEKKEGYILSCVRYAIEDIEIHVNDLGNIELPKPKTVPCKINKIQRASRDVVIVTLRIPPNSDFSFIAGQYIDIIGPNRIKRSYSIANYSKNKTIELHIKEVENGEFSDYWFNKAASDDLLRLNGPYGTFFLRDIDKDIVFLATGTGIAPFKSMLENIEAIQKYQDKAITLIWGVREEKDFHLVDINCTHQNFKFIPVLSRPSSNWNGKKGYVQNILLEEELFLPDCMVYACGSEKMIANSKKLLTSKGLNEDCFFSDAFVDSSDIIL
jgi:CDP-4-dehydro-6-deoxyglucose reductase